MPGTKTLAWTYNGTVPGPLIRARVGDRVVVHFKNSLPDATTIHWHGIRVPNAMDGAPGNDATARSRAARASSTNSSLKDAGTYWYHPHTDSSAQVGQGLYGAIVVEDPNDPKEFGDDLVLVVSDAGLTETGEFVPADSGGNFGDLFGREGSVVLVNGKAHPTLKVRAGKQQRWRDHQRVARALFQRRLARPPLRPARRGQRPRGALRGRLQPEDHAGRARGRRVHARGRAGPKPHACTGRR